AVQWVEFKLFLLTFTWDVAKEILVNVHFSELLSSSFNSLPPTMKGILLYIHLDKGLTILTQAFVTRFMLNMMGW
ncbi:MAG TPA: accessory cholera enterotoxin, partial [Aeromonas salmonicida]|nr:accessory cholera enterotoxin [Aeromonas salmonicida]